jgi:hypothetical protein
VGVGTGDGAGVGVAVGVGAPVGVGVGVAGRAVVGVAVDPHAARPAATIAAPMMVMSFMSTFTHSTRTRRERLHPGKCVERALPVIDELSRRDDARIPYIAGGLGCPSSLSRSLPGCYCAGPTISSRVSASVKLKSL